MSKFLALLSGKGGSGKTTLALSISTLLSKCHLRVLLVDCDLSTNGATYFYEGKLSERTKRVDSFYEIIVNCKERMNAIGVIEIDEYMDFLPSVSKITKFNSEVYRYSELDYLRMKTINEMFRDKYDVVIYDCQAGYTDVLKLVLPFVNINLVVMEADAISSAAIRSLYLKIGDVLNEKKVYQIFNKATNEEYDIYSKISGGTVFTNIDTIMFDWKIRKAFSLAQIPDLENTSARYGEHIYNICKVIFDEEKIQKNLKKFEIVINMNKNLEQELLLRDMINKQNEIRYKDKIKLIKATCTLIVPATIVLVMTIFMQLIDGTFIQANSDSFGIMILLLLIILMTMCISIVMIYDITKDKRYRIQEMSENNKKMTNILKEKQMLEIQYKEIMKENEK